MKELLDILFEILFISSLILVPTLYYVKAITMSVGANIELICMILFFILCIVDKITK